MRNKKKAKGNWRGTQLPLPPYPLVILLKKNAEKKTVTTEEDYYNRIKLIQLHKRRHII
jgi:hypothetical protein